MIERTRGPQPEEDDFDQPQHDRWQPVSRKDAIIFWSILCGGTLIWLIGLSWVAAYVKGNP